MWQLYFQLFEETAYSFPQWLHQFTFPTTVYEGSLFSTPPPAFIFCKLFDDSHSDWCEVISHCGFDLHFSNISGVEHLFKCLLAQMEAIKILFYFILIFNFIYLFIYSFIFGCAGSSLLRAGFLQLQRVGATLRCSVQASHCGGFSCCRAQAVVVWASIVVARGLSNCGSQALERRLSSCGTRAQLLHSMWDLPGPGLEPVSPALAGRFLTTVPPEKP